MLGLGARLDAVDRYQRQHRWLGFPLAVRKQYGDANTGYAAATMAFYGFFSIFPLLLVFVSVLGFVLRSHPSWRDSVVNSALGDLPVIGHQIETKSLSGSTIGIVIGAAGALWSGMSVFLASEKAMNDVWSLDRKERPSYIQSRLRALILLSGLGLAAIATTGIGSLSTVGANLGIFWKLGSFALSFLLNLGLFSLAFRMLTDNSIAWRSLRGGACVAALAYTVLQLVGGYYINHVISSSSNTYGTFALVIGLLTWIRVAASILLYAAEGNVVATRKLWPQPLR